MLTVDRTISPNDTMFAGGEEHYFSVGRKAVEEIERVVDNPATILDLPCGHGRVLRWLRVAYPDAAITACDLDRDGVDFCAETFGATPVYSTEDPALIPLQGCFELIWCGSLFTHLDAPRWKEFLGVFREHLRGVLVFTVLGPYAAYLARNGSRIFGVSPERRAQMLRSYDEQGFGYAEYSGTSGYGQAIASPEWVRSQLDDFQLLSYREHAWNPTQDVIAVTS